MYRCELCQQSAPVHTPMMRICPETRTHRYPARPKAHPIRRKNTKTEYRADPGGEGFAIVREAIVCPACAARVAEKRLD